VIGHDQPADARTDTTGRATVTFRAGSSSGIAIISAASGGATTANGSSSSSSTPATGTATTTTSDRNVRIAVGAAAVGRVTISSNPAVLPTGGGVATVTANVLDLNGNALSSAPVTFTTTAGTLAGAVVTTDAAGAASVNLTTFQQATVTATVGVSASTGGTGTTGNATQTGSSNTQANITISLTNSPTLAITVPTTPPSAGLPATYSFKVTAASASGGGTGTGTGTTTPGTVAIKELVVNWGDGVNQNLGAVSVTRPSLIPTRDPTPI